MAKRVARKIPRSNAKKKSAPKKAAKRKAARRKVARSAAPKAAEAPPAPARGGVVHWEVQAIDGAKQQAFYAELFGWKIDTNNPGSYGIVSAASERSIGGGFANVGPGEPPRVTFYVGVPSIDETLAKVSALGGQATMSRTNLGMVVMAQFRDPEGNIIGLVEG
jgi:predicted enzyme related to lactoylglutathione lyase